MCIRSHSDARDSLTSRGFGQVVLGVLGVDICARMTRIVEEFDSGSGTFLQRGSPPPPPWRLLPAAEPIVTGWQHQNSNALLSWRDLCSPDRRILQIQSCLLAPITAY